MHRIFAVLILAASLGRGQDMPAYSLHMIGHAHIDLAYRWRWNEVVHRVGPDTFRGVLRMMDQERGLTFAQSQMALYEAIQKEYPDLFQAIRKRIAEGRWVVVGGMWVEPDMMIPSGESFVRQFLLGKQYARRELGVDVKVAWAPDAFCGQINTVPQILKGAGMDYYIFGRGQPPDKRMFWWESPDGSRVPAMGVFATYSAPPLTSRMFPMLAEFCNRAPGSKSVLVLYGRGDHGGGPREEDVAAIHAMQKAPGMPKVQYDTPQRFLDTVVAPLKDKLPVYQESLGGMTGISYVSQARAKLGNRRSENLLLTAEMFNTIGTFYQRKPNYPRVDFNAVWKPVLKNQFHDVLPGTANGRVYDGADAEYGEVYREGHALLTQGLEYIGARIDTRGDGIPLIVYNPVSWTRSDVVEAGIRFTGPVAEFAIRDPKGGDVPYQVIESRGDTRRVLLLVRDVPSLGYRMLRVLPGTRRSFQTALQVTSGSLENEFLKATYNDSGVLTSIYDKRTRREAVAALANVLELAEEDPSRSSAWISVPAAKRTPLQPAGKPELIEKGPLRAVLRMHYHATSSTFTIDTILYAGVPRLEFRFDADWHESDRLLTASFPTTIRQGTAAFERPYGFEETPPNGERQCAQQWVDLSGVDFGLSLLNDGKYEFYADGNMLRMGILRGARDMDPRMDEGPHSFRYALYPHAGSWKDAHTVRQGYELNHPLIAMQESPHTGVFPAWGDRRGDFSLPAEKSFVSVTAPGVVITVVKMQQEEWTPGAMVVRLHETTGRPAKGELLTPFQITGAVETNLIEEPIGGKLPFRGAAVPLEMRPRELKTFRLEFGASGHE